MALELARAEWRAWVRGKGQFQPSRILIYEYYITYVYLKKNSHIFCFEKASIFIVRRMIHGCIIFISFFRNTRWHIPVKHCKVCFSKTQQCLYDYSYFLIHTYIHTCSEYYLICKLYSKYGNVWSFCLHFERGIFYYYNLISRNFKKTTFAILTWVKIKTIWFGEIQSQNKCHQILFIKLITLQFRGKLKIFYQSEDKCSKKIFS